MPTDAIELDVRVIPPRDKHPSQQFTRCNI